MALFRNSILIAFGNIILCQVEGIRAVKVSDLISGSVSDVNHNKFENNKNSAFKHFLPSGVWSVRHVMSTFYISVGVTLYKLKIYLKYISKSVIAMLKLSYFG